MKREQANRFILPYTNKAGDTLDMEPSQAAEMNKSVGKEMGYWILDSNELLNRRMK
jgi:hypothetical protein